jgi:glycosyltransferase involved in cell wall biosynthesis
VSERRVYLLLVTGDATDAHSFVATRYPECECVVLSKRELREAGWRGQIRFLRGMRGEALIFFLRCLSDLQEPRLTLCSALLHRCPSTVLADSKGKVLAYSGVGLLRLVPGAIASAISDLFVLVSAWLLLGVLRISAAPVDQKTEERDGGDLDLAYLYPYPLDTAQAGGALTHVEGFLSGVVAKGGSCEVFSGRSLPVERILQHVIPARRRLFLFRESLLLSYNLQFASEVRTGLRSRRPRALYQRHGRFVVTGAMLTRRLGIPLVLEYNGSEVFVSKHWNASRFQGWLSVCEEVSIRGAHRIVVVSEGLRQELIERGVPQERILLNPNGVNPEVFRPDSGGPAVRIGLGIPPTDIVVGFVGSFDLWHGMHVLADAIQQLLTVPLTGSIQNRLKFLLVGDGTLYPEIRRSLEGYVGDRVFFAGLVSHAKVPAYLDAADILVSPHIPMPDGRPFFGSPTKLFEYMAMGKGIIASNLDQLSEVLEHGRSAWLVPPGSASELATAILLLAQDAGLRSRLGESARASAIAHHTWKQNAERVLNLCSGAAARDSASPTLNHFGAVARSE